MTDSNDNSNQGADRASGHDSQELAARLWADMRDRHERGVPRSVEEYLADPDVPRDDLNLLLDLVYGEFALREQEGEAPQPAEYVKRFPQLKEKLERQLEVHAALLEASTHMHGGDTSVGAAAPGVDAGGAGDVPERIGKYRVVSRLGSGGQATVYRAVHPTLGLDLAIKVSHHQLNVGAARRLATEGRILAELRHSNLARVFDLDQHDGHPFVAMEFVPGRTVEQVVLQARPAPREAARIVALIARAVEHAHGQGVLHLDIKPANILVSEDGVPRLIDFGFGQFHSSWTERPAPTVELGGTLAYLPPERAAGIPGTQLERADVFGLGGVLYYLLTGRAPFVGRSAAEIWDKIRRGEWDLWPLDDDSVPTELREICRKCMAHDPHHRYASAEEVASALEEFCQRGAANRRYTLIAIGLSLLLGVGIVGAAIGSRVHQQQPETPAAQNPPVATPSALARLELRVWNGNRFQDLLHALPLQAGNEVRVEAEYPQRFHALLLWVDSEGTVRELGVGKPDAEKLVLIYPGTGQAVPLAGRAGTQLVLLCGHRDQAVSLASLKEKLKEVRNWPALPRSSVVRLGADGIRVESTSRGLGSPREKPDPEGIVKDRLSRLQLELRGDCTVFAALAVSHE